MNSWDQPFSLFTLFLYRKMQAGEVGASSSDILTDKADDDEAHMPERCVRVECDETLI